MAAHDDLLCSLLRRGNTSCQHSRTGSGSGVLSDEEASRVRYDVKHVMQLRTMAKQNFGSNHLAKMVIGPAYGVYGQGALLHGIQCITLG